MLKIAASPRFTHPVAVMVPVDGGHAEQTFKATFRVLPMAVQDGFNLGSTDGLTGFLRDVLLDASDVADDAGQPVPWSDALRDQLLEMSYVRVALLRTYLLAMNKARLGN